MTSLRLESFQAQAARWPTAGRHVLAQYDDESVVLSLAVPSTYWDHRYPDRAAWQADVARSDVRLQWDPDHDPYGTPVTRRAVQLGQRGETLARYAREWIRRIEDITPFVREQHARLQTEGPAALTMPHEQVYPCLASSRVGSD